MLACGLSWREQRERRDSDGSCEEGGRRYSAVVIAAVIAVMMVAG